MCIRDRHRLVKKKLFGVVLAAVWITAGLVATSVVLTSFNPLLTSKEFKYILLTYYSLFLFCLLIIFVSYSSIAIKNCLCKTTSSPWCSQQRKKTDQNTVHCYSCILTANAAWRYFRDSSFIVISPGHNPSLSSMVSITFICHRSSFCKLFSKSSTLYI